MPDYSCYFSIGNYTDAPLRLKAEWGPAAGYWVSELTPHCIGPGESKMVHLKDYAGVGNDTNGVVTYTVDWAHAKTKPVIKMWMRCVYWTKEGYGNMSAVEVVDYEPKDLIEVSAQDLTAWDDHPLTTRFTISYKKQVDYAFNIAKIIQPSTLCPVLDEDGLSPHFFRDQPLWAKASGNEAIPAIISMTDEPQIILSGQGDPKLSELAFKIVGQCNDEEGNNFTVTANFHIDSASGSYQAVIPFKPNGIRKGIPWGFRGTIDWKVDYPHNGQSVAIGSTPLEIYAISRALHPFLAIDGVPLKLLRFIVLPTRTWKKYSESPRTPVEHFDSYVVHRIHWDTGFKYETQGGATSYASLYFTRLGSYNLSKWLKNLHQTPPLKQYYVNCYDQAGIVAICMGFCFPDSFEEPSSQGLRYFYMEPFGYIPEGHLVGWSGVTNNPFFGGDENQMVLTKDMDDEAGVVWRDRNGVIRERSPFRDHVFLTWNGRVLDATFGPTTGKTISEYLKGGRDYDEDLEQECLGTFRHLNLCASMANLGGVLSMNQTSADNVGSVYWEAAIDPKLEKDLLQLITKDQVDAQEKAYFNIKNLFKTLKAKFTDSYEVGGSLSHAELNTFPNPGHRVNWEMTFKDSEMVIHSVELEIYICEDTLNTRRLLRRSILTKNSGRLGDLKSTTSGVPYLIDEGPSSSHVHWGYKTACVNLSAHEALKHDTLIQLVEEIQAYIARGKSADEASVDVEKPNLDEDKLANFVEGDTMTIDLHVTHAVDDYDWSYHYGNVLVKNVKKQAHVPGKPGETYTFTIYARKHGIDQIIFTFRDEFYRTCDVRVPFNVVSK